MSKLTLEEKVNVTTGQDLAGRCVGNTGVSSCQLQYRNNYLLSLDNSPSWLERSLSSGQANVNIPVYIFTYICLGWPFGCALNRQCFCIVSSCPQSYNKWLLIRSFSPAAINVATTWDRDLIYKRGNAMGAVRLKPRSLSSVAG